MIPIELRDYKLLRKIQRMCREAKDWDGPISFESVSKACDEEIDNLKKEIGYRVVAYQDE